MDQSGGITHILACPACKNSLTSTKHGGYRCQNSECAKEFPVVNGIPILINEQNSVFDLDSIASSQRDATTGSGTVRRQQ